MASGCSPASEIEALRSSVPDSGGVIVVPAFSGLGAPHWRPEARGAITGLSRGTTRGHLARATLEGIALQNVDILRAMERDAGRALTVLKVDGGASANDLLMQFQADVLGVGDLAARAGRDHRARRGVPRRPRHRRVEGSGTGQGHLARAAAVFTCRGSQRRRRAPRALGRRGAQGMTAVRLRIDAVRQAPPLRVKTWGLLYRE